MHLELFVGAIRGAVLELASMQFKQQWPGFVAWGSIHIDVFLQRYLKPKDGVLLGDDLDLVLSSDNLKDKLPVFHHNALDADSSHTATPDNLNHGAVEVGTGEHRPGSGRRQVPGLGFLSSQTQDVADIVAPHFPQGQVDGVFALLLWDVVNAQCSFLFGGEGPGLL